MIVFMISIALISIITLPILFELCKMGIGKRYEHFLLRMPSIILLVNTIYFFYLASIDKTLVAGLFVIIGLIFIILFGISIFFLDFLISKSHK